TDPPEDSNPLHAAGDEDATDVIDAVAGAAASADADRSDQDSESADQRGHDDDATEAYEPVGSDADDEPEHVEGALTEQGDEPGEGRKPEGDEPEDRDESDNSDDRHGDSPAGPR